MKKFTIILIGILALLSCGNPFVNSILPDKNGNKTPVIVDPVEPVDPKDPNAITIKIVLSDNVTGDSVTASPAISKDGEEVTLNYNVAKAKLNNRLVFSGTKTVIEQVNGAGSGSKKYIVNKQDSTEGVITIHAVFSHSDKEFDNIAFADSDNESKVYGSGNFTKAIINTGRGSGAISYASSDLNVATVNNTTGEVTILKVGTTDITATKAADAEYEHAEAVYTLTVTHLQLTIANPVITTTKTYDGNTDAVVTEGELTNKVEGDDVTVSAVANFASKNAGDRQITVVYTISGADAGNYTKPVNYTIGGTINKLQLTVTESVTDSKPYDGNTNAAVSITSSNKISTDTLTITPAGTYNAATVAGANLITVSYTLGGADAGNYDKPANHTTPGTITKAAGSAVSVPTRASRTQDSITVNAVTILSPNLGQTAEYAFSDSTSEPVSGWGSALTFTGLTNGTTYYIFARATGNSDNCNVGTASRSVGMKTITNNPDRKTVINFEADTIGQTYAFTKGQGSPTVKVASDPGNSGQKSLQITTASGSNSWNEAAIVPVYLPYPLSSYESFSFRFRLLSGNTGTNLNGRTIDVYLASDPADFKDGGFGNPADSSYTKFADKLLGSTPTENFGENHKNKWTEYEIVINNLGAAIINLQGNIFIAIGINCQSQADYMLDDLTFILKDDYIAAPFITPTSAIFDLKTGSQADIPVTVALQGNTLTGIISNGTTFSSSDYTDNGKTVILKKEYLALQTEGTTTTFTFTFSDGTTKNILITIWDSSKPILVYDFSNANTKITSGYPLFNLPAPTPANRASIITASDGKRVLEVVINRARDVVILPFNLGDKQLKDYQSVTYRLRRMDANNDNNTKDTNWKNLHAQFKVDPSGTFGAGNSSSNKTFAQLGNAMQSDEKWYDYTVNLNSDGNNSTLKGFIEIAFYAEAFLGRYQIELIRLNPKP